MDAFKYQVAISFAGEDRAKALELAQELRREGLKVFYDETEKDELVANDLVEKFHEVFYKSSQFCVMFVSRAYIEKPWTTHERKSAFSRDLEQRGEYLFLIRLDDTEVPGLPTSRHYFRWPPEDAQTIAAAIKAKMNRGDNAMTSALLRGKASGGPSIRQSQLLIESIYRESNNALSLEYLYSRLARHAGYLAKRVSQGEAQAADFIRPISWLFALSSQLSIDVQDAFLTKYPDKCPSCLQRVCVCFRTNKLPLGEPSIEDIQEELRLAREQVLRDHNKVDFDVLVKMICTIYPNNSVIWRYAGPRFHMSKLWEEVSEVDEAISGLMSGRKRLSAVADEVADVLAWILGAWNLSSNSSQLQREFDLYYANGCPVCGHPRCICKPYGGRPQNLFDVSKLKSIRVTLCSIMDIEMSLTARTTELIKIVDVALQMQNDQLTRFSLYKLNRELTSLKRDISGSEISTKVMPYLTVAVNELDSMRI